jgi:WD40 repeat protein
LRKESGIGFDACRSGGAVIQPQAVAQAIRQGDWGNVQRAIILWQDDDPSMKGGDSLSARIAEQVILELAEDDNHLSLAYSLFKVHRETLDRIEEVEETENDAKTKKDDADTKGMKMTTSTSSTNISKARSLEQRLAAISANSTKFADKYSRQQVLYGETPKPDRREALASRVESLRAVPLDRLPVLIQQSMKWQSHTGQLPWVKEVLHDPETTGDNIDERATKKKRRKRKRYDLVMGEAAADIGIMVGEGVGGSGGGDDDDEYEARESIPQGILSKVKFGKSVVCEAAIFSSLGLVTGSSDGLVEIWDPTSSYRELNTVDYPFQKDNAMGHNDTAIMCLSISTDEEILVSGDALGRVKLWKTVSGKCLRQFQAHDGAVTALSLSRDASKLLTGSSSGICREFGVLNQTVLKELEGHTSHVYACNYILNWTFSEDKNPQSAAGEGWIASASADGTVRIWKRGICVRILQPPPTTGRRSLSLGKSSFVVDPTQVMSESPAIHGLIPLVGQYSHLIVVPRSSMAYLVNLEGTLLQLFEAETGDADFVAATASSSVVYLTTTKGDCLVFSIRSGKHLKTIRDFSKESTSKTNTDHRSAEISSIIHHPFKPSIVAAFSNDKTQKKGILAVWK